VGSLALGCIALLREWPSPRKGGPSLIRNSHLACIAVLREWLSRLKLIFRLALRFRVSGQAYHQLILKLALRFYS
jgi:hypothetical protein